MHLLESEINKWIIGGVYKISNGKNKDNKQKRKHYKIVVFKLVVELCCKRGGAENTNSN